MKNTFLVLVSVLCTVVFSYGLSAAEEYNLQTGIELDALPYITGGYYGSFWTGYEGWRLRGIVTNINLPKFAVEDGYKDAETQAYSVLIDKFIGKNASQYTGLWVGAGMEFWQNSIKREGFTQSADYDNYQFTVGAGYIWNIGNNFYINPWFAGHFQVAGDDEVSVSGKTYSPKQFMQEASLKIGWKF